ncbi:acyltransferase family protein [Streptacidiphilus cavernicola]|uniref:Acyltransferase family protein n=1 Tax=Streptacidiphilus cavernicola TaxID=3342716 RepID=A0ABV6VYK3_9ACTN
MSLSPTARPGQGTVRVGGRVDSLTGLRWFAALGVFCFHIAPTLAPLAVLVPLMRTGYEGVPFFFVLSGFVLTWSARPGDSIRSFYVRRFARVWPLLAVTLLPALAIVHFWDRAPFSPSGTLTTLTLTQAWTTDDFYTANIVTWTLSCEAFFYLLHPFLLRALARLRPPGLLAVAAVMTLLTLLTRIWPGSDGLSFEVDRLTYASPLALTPMFVVGMCTALAVRQGWRPRLGVPPVLGLLALVVALRWRSSFQPGLIPGLPPTSGDFDAVVVPLFALLIAAAALGDLERGGRLLASPFLVRLGEWSFAFYLVHFTVLTAFEHYGVPDRAGDSPAGQLLVTLLMLAAAVLVAAGCHLAVEKPADRRIRTALRASRTAADSGPASASGSGSAAGSGSELRQQSPDGQRAQDPRDGLDRAPVAAVVQQHDVPGQRALGGPDDGVGTGPGPVADVDLP